MEKNNSIWRIINHMIYKNYTETAEEMKILNIMVNKALPQRNLIYFSCTLDIFHCYGLVPTTICSSLWKSEKDYAHWSHNLWLRWIYTTTSSLSLRNFSALEVTEVIIPRLFTNFRKMKTQDKKESEVPMLWAEMFTCSVFL